MGVEGTHTVYWQQWQAGVVWRNDACGLRNPSLLCSLSEGTTSLKPPYLWLPGRFGHCKAPEKDRSGEWWVFITRFLLTVALLPAVASPLSLPLPPVSALSL